MSPHRTDTDPAATRRMAYRLLCLFDEERTRVLAAQLQNLVEANEFTARFTDEQWEALRDVADALWDFGSALEGAHEKLESLLVVARRAAMKPVQRRG